MAVGLDRRTKIDQACQSGDEFAKLYYETFDKRRHLLSNLYLESATAVWNGNPVAGKDSISKFYETLPASESELRTVDAHPISDDFVQGQTTVLVAISGQVKYTGKSACLFSQSFLLTAQQGTQKTVWKIASDCFRFHEPVL